MNINIHAFFMWISQYLQASTISLPHTENLTAAKELGSFLPYKCGLAVLGTSSLSDDPVNVLSPQN